MPSCNIKPEKQRIQLFYPVPVQALQFLEKQALNIGNPFYLKERNFICPFSPSPSIKSMQYPFLNTNPGRHYRQ